MDTREITHELTLWLLGLNEPACQSDHQQTVCTIHVTHRIRSCEPPLLVCAATAEWAKRFVNTPPTVCAGCGMNSRLCWTITPI